MIKAVIFDLDGTLSYTLDSIALSGNSALKAINMSTYDTERYKYYCGDGADELVKRMLFDNGDTEYLQFNELKEQYLKYFSMYADYNVRPYDGLPEIISALKDNNLKLAVLSNKPHPQTIEVVEKLYGKNTFDYIQGNTETIRRKPSPDGAFIIAKKLGVECDECLYVGDTCTDMQTGNSAGMHTVGVLWGYRDYKELSDNNAEHIIDKPEELPGIIYEMNMR